MAIAIFAQHFGSVFTGSFIKRSKAVSKSGIFANLLDVAGFAERLDCFQLLVERLLAQRQFSKITMAIA